ncbi:hypothetical protein IED13_09675 [Bosea sp. SSUT16]|uniref:Uncharacterized protein n=1 Tax=Bosea spartocytisi TaxID=2773451 RepID=A0A927HZY4_9HYPH|nr:hypothetical protein [Bosea spartocytisi]MBD3845966.1 hypothetical protein [Bosea spartocytisi]MCT4473150.1 hypothetical protein [Bosea spartocytisi]
MRHERPLPGQPSPIEELNAEIFKRRTHGAQAVRTRGDIGDGRHIDGDLKAAVLADMVKVLNENRLDRGYADIYDLKRAGYHEEAAAHLGPLAAKEMAREIAEKGARYGLDQTEAA